MVTKEKLNMATTMTHLASILDADSGVEAGYLHKSRLGISSGVAPAAGVGPLSQVLT